MLTRNHAASARFFGVCAALLILWAYVLVAWLDAPVKESQYSDSAVAKRLLVEAALDRQLEAERREEAAQEYCGNAGWKISEDNKTLTCIPRKGKPYKNQLTSAK